MLTKYYYTRQGEDYIIANFKHLERDYEFTLYKNDQLLDKQRGIFGEYLLQGDEIELSIKKKYLRTSHKLMYKGLEVEMKKVSLRKLRGILKMARINNELNQQKEDIDQRRWWRKVLQIAFLLILAIVIQYYIQDMKRLPYQLIGFIPSSIGAWMLYDILADRFRWNKEYIKSRLLFMLATAILIIVLFEELI